MDSFRNGMEAAKKAISRLSLPQVAEHGHCAWSTEFVIANKHVLKWDDDPNAPAAFGKTLFVFTTDNPHINDGDIF